MKKIISLISILLVVFLLSGCSNSNSGTIICKTESRGENPTIVTYEEYVVENNKVTKFEKYNTLDFSDDYLAKLSLDTVIEVYEADPTYKVEKVDSNTLKTSFVDPKNYYENIETDDMLETIRASIEDNQFSLYKYTCEIK